MKRKIIMVTIVTICLSVLHSIQGFMYVSDPHNSPVRYWLPSKKLRNLLK